MSKLFELDDEIFDGAGETIVRQRLEGYSRFFTFKIRESSQKTFELIGLVIYWVPAGTQREI